MAKVTGTAGDDNLTGTSGNDKFVLGQGGNDTASGGDGNDQFVMNATLTAADRIDGGTGTDTVTLKGDYSAGVVFEAGTIVGIEKLHLLAGFDYNLTTDDANVAAGERLAVNASALKTGDSLIFDGSAEMDGGFTIQAGAGDDTIIGGALRDIFVLSKGGNDIVHGGAGNDLFTMGGSLTAADQLDGGTGPDTLSLDGNYSGTNAIVLGANTITNIETIVLAGGHTYNLTTNDGNVAVGQTLTVDAGGIASAFVFNGAAETDGSLVIIGGAGGDTLTGGNGGNTFDLTHGGRDTANGGQGLNIFDLGASLDTADRINGALGASNTMILNGAYSGLTVTNTMIANIQTLDIQGTNAVSLIWKQSGALTVDGSVAGGSLTFDFSTVTSALHYIGGALNAQINGGTANDTFDGGTGTDIFSGNNGNDVFNLGSGLAAADKIDGGAGSDILTLNGDYGAGITFGATTVTNVETLQLVSSGHDYNITTDDATVGAGLTFTVDGGALTSARHLTFNGGAETNGSFAFIGGAGNDVLTGGAQNDTFDLTRSGNDTAKGGDGNDTFNLGAVYNINDKIDGGAGFDTLVLNGSYVTTFSTTSLVNVEEIQLADGHNYNLTTKDGNVGAGQTLVIDASALEGNTLTFDGSAETDGFFSIVGGFGSDSITLGAAFKAADHISGGEDGNDTLSLNGDYSAGFVFGATTIQHIDTLLLAGGHSYSFTTNDGNLDTDEVLTVNASALAAGQTLIFDGSAETDGVFNITAGAGDDTLSLGGGFSAQSKIDGGAGTDTVSISGDISVTLTATNLVNIEALQFGAGHDYSITTVDATVASGVSLTVNAGALGASDSFVFNGGAETNGSFAFTGGAGNDTITGGALADTFDVSQGGNDTLHAGGGDEMIVLGATLTAADAIDGGSGSDTLSLNGDYSAGVVFGSATLTNVETILFASGHSYNLTTADATVASGLTLTVNGSALDAGDSLTFDGSAETNGKFAITGGAGDDNLTGGAGNDTFDLTHGGSDHVVGGLGLNTYNFGETFDSSDSVTGVDGSSVSNTVDLNGDYSAGLTLGANSLIHVSNLNLEGGFDYVITLNDGNVAANRTISIGATEAHSLTLDGSAETDGGLNVTASAGDDHLTGGQSSDLFDLTPGGNDTVYGMGGRDFFFTIAHTGHDTFVYKDVTESTGAGRDRIDNVNFSTDSFNIGTIGSVTDIDSAIHVGAMSEATFDANLASAVNETTLAANHAVLFTASSGNLSGHIFLVIDENGMAGYQSGADLVIEIGATGGTLTLSDFS